MVVFVAGLLFVECSFAAPVALVGFPTDVEGGAGVDSARKLRSSPSQWPKGVAWWRWKLLFVCFDCRSISACGTQRLR